MLDPTSTEILSDEEMQARFEGGPSVANAVFALVGDRIYKREDGAWRLLDVKGVRDGS